VTTSDPKKVMICPVCMKEITWEQVSKNNSKFWCKSCANDGKKEWIKKKWENDPGGYIRYKKSENLRKNHGITINDYDKMKELQGNVCAICRKELGDRHDAHVDHNHKTEEIRGILCNNCNAALGFIDDNEDILWSMMEYLKRTTWSKVA